MADNDLPSPEILEDLGVDAETFVEVMEDPQAFIERQMISKRDGGPYDETAVEFAVQVMGVSSLVSRGIDYDLAVEIIDRDSTVKLTLADGKLKVTFDFDVDLDADEADGEDTEQGYFVSKRGPDV